ncbi:MAG: S9 family peptidase [Acidobacteria bacterium]|nr:S9 family peptidase [Acidobacteriota bacterium]
MRRFATLIFAALAQTLTLTQTLTLALALPLPLPLGAQEKPQGWTPEAMMQVKRLDTPRPSPDGRWVAFTVRTLAAGPDPREFRTQILLSPTTGTSSRRALTPAEASSLDPQWSPDGKRLAFRSRRDGTMQIHVLSLDGGETEAVTQGKEDVRAFAWSPDGRQFAYTTEDSKTAEKAGARWHEEEKSPMTRLQLIPLGGGPEGRRAPRLLTPESQNVTDFDWAPDGSAIAYAHTRSASANDWTTEDLSLVNLRSGQTRPLASSSAVEASPKFSRDGRTLAFTLSDAPPRGAYAHRVALLDLASGGLRTLPATPDSVPVLLGWAGDGKHLLVAEPFRVKGAIYAMDVAEGSLLRLDTEPWTVAVSLMVGSGSFVELDPTGRYVGMVVQTNAEPPAIAFSPLAPFAPRILSKPNEDLPAFPMPRTEVVRWKGAGGLEIEGLLTYPLNSEPGVKVPLLVWPHGGPTQSHALTYAANPIFYPVAALAAQGIATLRTNIRGSSGYGRDFRFANMRDWGGADYQDMMAGVDHVIALGIADPSRLGIAGWSFGGYMASWTITQTHRFKAASVGAGISDLVSFQGTTDVPGFLSYYFGGESWDIQERYQARSAIFHIKGVTTPTLIQHGDADLRVPPGQSYELYRAIKGQGVETRMQVLPRQGHALTGPLALQRAAEANLAWFSRWLKETPDQGPALRAWQRPQRGDSMGAVPRPCARGAMPRWKCASPAALNDPVISGEAH